MIVEQTKSILERVIDAGQSIGNPQSPSDPVGISPELARLFLAWHFTDDDRQRMDHLSAKARAGTLSPEEEHEFREFCVVGDLLSLLQLRARDVLKHPPAP